ncbi:MAG: hypothetical protein ACRD2E_07095 [Terriglobales bacterium]
MDFSSVQSLADAVLFEGYSLYPYRPSAIKNRQRWNFGTLYPECFSRAAAANDAFRHQVECLVAGTDANVCIEGQLRFLQTCPAGTGEASVSVRTLAIPPLFLSTLAGAEPIRRGDEWGLTIALAVTASPLDQPVWRLRLTCENLTPITATASRETALDAALISAQVLLGVEGGEFFSLLNPPEGWRQAAGSCQNQGVFPVLAGLPGSDLRRGAFLLAAPIVLYDFARLAAESAGDFFDNTEIDEMLALRVATLTEEEKCEMRTDPRTRNVLARVEAMEQDAWERLHGRADKK